MKENAIKKYFANEIATLKSQTTRAEYISWWVLRGIMLFAVIYANVKKYDAIAILIISLNACLTFIIPLLRIVFFLKWFLGKLPYRVQSYINIFIFFGAFLGQTLNFYGIFSYRYDKFLHVISGGIAVFIGNELVNIFKNGKNTPFFIRCFVGTGFSYIVMVIWEIFEFFADFYIEGSNNQDYSWTPDKNMLFFNIFGTGWGNELQYPLFDTFMDLLCAIIGCAVCGFTLYFVLRYKDRKKTFAALREKEAVNV